MKIFVSLLLSLCFASICIGQNLNTLNIQEIFITDSSEVRSSSDFKVKNKSKTFYEDENYIVSTICNGEWGGAIIFKSKKTGIKYSCSSTCPEMIYRINGKYYVTNSLMHMAGSSDVIEIDDPSKMYILKNSPSQTNYYSLYDYPEAFYKQGVIKLADTVGISITKSFVADHKVYHLMRDVWNKVYISTAQNGHFKIIDSLPNGNLLYFSKAFETADDHYLIFFNSDPVNGYIDIYGNEIKIFRFDRLKDSKYDPVLAWQITDLQKQRYHCLIDSLYNPNFDNAAFLKYTSFNSNRNKPEFIYQALFNNDSSQFVAFYIEEKETKFNSILYWETNVIWGKKADNRWNYSIHSQGSTLNIHYVKSREATLHYLFNMLQESDFFKSNSIIPDPAFWESRNFKDIRLK